MQQVRASNLYEFHVRGELSDVVLTGFADLRAVRLKGETVLVGPITDQAALFGVLGQIQALVIHLIEVRRGQQALTQPPS
jgi:hypothetical protein